MISFIRNEKKLPANRNKKARLLETKGVITFCPFTEEDKKPNRFFREPCPDLVRAVRVSPRLVMSGKERREKKMIEG